MRIICNSGEFDLPVDLKLTNTEYNQLLNDIGEQSLPFTLPPTPNNLRMINYSNRLDAYYKPIQTMPVDMVTGVFMKPGNMAIHSASERNGISCTLYFNEANFYSAIDEKTMKDVVLDVFSDPNYPTPTPENLAARVDYLIAMLKSEYLTQNSEFFSVFPVNTSTSLTRVYKYLDRGTNELTDYEEKINYVLNGFETNLKYTPDATAEKVIELAAMMGETAQEFKNGDKIIPCTKGYGMTAFVNLFYYLQKLFIQFGYSFDDNQIRNHVNGVGGRIVILNSVADAIYDGKLDLNQLVPNVTLKDFLKKVNSLLGGKFIIDELDKKVTYQMYTDIFEADPAADFSSQMSSPLEIQAVDFKKMAVCNSADSTFKKAADTTYIEASFTPEAEYKMVANPHSNERSTKITFRLSLFSVGNMIHKNSTVIDPDVTENETEPQNDQLLLVGVRHGVQHVEPHYAVYRNGETGILDFTLKYYKGYTSIYRTSNDPLSFLTAMYAQYLDFVRHSNIQLSLTCHFTPDVLDDLDLTNTYLFDSVPCMIDKMEYSLPVDQVYKLTLRTVKPYADRQ